MARLLKRVLVQFQILIRKIKQFLKARILHLSLGKTFRKYLL